MKVHCINPDILGTDSSPFLLPFLVALERWRVPLNDEAPATKAAEDPPPSYSELFPDYAAVPQQSTDSN